MIKNLRFLFVILFLFISSCSNDGNHAELAVASPSDQANEHIAGADSNEKDELLQLRLQLDDGNFRQIEGFIKQTEAYLATDSMQISAEVKSTFPQLSKEMMVDFLRSLDANTFSQSRSHEMLYTFNIATDGYIADSDECPDWIRLSKDENTNEYNLLLTSKFLVDQEFGCAESGTVYVFTIDDGKLLLRGIDFAG